MTTRRAYELPSWVTTNEESLVREAADYIEMSPAQRAQIMQVLGRDAQKLLAVRPDRERALAHRDALPESSVRLLTRLRASHRAARLEHG